MSLSCCGLNPGIALQQSKGGDDGHSASVCICSRFVAIFTIHRERADLRCLQSGKTKFDAVRVCCCVVVVRLFTVLSSLNLGWQVDKNGKHQTVTLTVHTSEVCRCLIVFVVTDAFVVVQSKITVSSTQRSNKKTFGQSESSTQAKNLKRQTRTDMRGLVSIEHSNFEAVTFTLLVFLCNTLTFDV